MKTNKYTIVNEICSMYLDKQCSIALVAEKLAISSHKVRYWLEKRGISRRDRSKAAYLANSQRFNKHSCSIRKNLSAKEKELLIAGIMLYWAEGWKKNSNYISFTNSEPR